ncbi:MAG: DUF4272 domain-containing protein [Actinocatenispora sp.]
MGRVIAAPDPVAVRVGTLDELERLGVRLPPPHYPLVWDPGDAVELRRRGELAARCAVLGMLLASRAGLPRWQAMRWLRDAQLLERVTPVEWRFVAGGVGNPAVVDLAVDALHGLAWLLGLVDDLDPVLPGTGGLLRLLPDPWSSGRDYPIWRSGVLSGHRDPADAAALLDLYYCLDWSYQENQRRGEPMPGPVPAVAIGARRWALEWGVVLHGPYHTGPLGWEDVDMSV